MTDIFSREETGLAVFGFVRHSFQNKYIPADISKLIAKFWDDTNYCVIKGNEFEAFLSKKTNLFTHSMLVDAAFRLVSFKLTLQKKPETKWTLQMTDNNTDKNGFVPICLVYYEIFCEEIDYCYKDTRIFDRIHHNEQTWIDSSLQLRNVNKLQKYKKNPHKEKQLTFGVFIQLLSKKYRRGYRCGQLGCRYIRDPEARFNDYHKKIMMKSHIKYQWINPIHSNKQASIFSPSFDHGNWCLKYVRNTGIYLRLLRVHGLIEKLIIHCEFQMKTKKHSTNTEIKDRSIYCEDLKWIPITKCKEDMIECSVDITILKAFKITETEISKIKKMYWYVYGIQKSKPLKKERLKKGSVKKEWEKKQANELLSGKKETTWRFKNRKKVKYSDNKYTKTHK